VRRAEASPQVWGRWDPAGVKLSCRRLRPSPVQAAIARRVCTTASGFRLIESMPCSTRKRANLGIVARAWPQMPILRPQRFWCAIHSDHVLTMA